jgi:putative tricarboxylic transport membrane protein
MQENIAQALVMLLSVENFLYMFFGMLAGVIIGAIPGLTGAMAVTLILPFTFYMHPLPALLLLIAVYKGALYGGAISAILIKTPGSASAAATVLDGWPLAQQGKGGKALHIALLATCTADFIANLALIFFAGMIAAFALRFGPPEFFMLICFSLTVVATLSSGAFFKGLISACIGLFLATIGLDLVYGTNRLTFGSVEMMSGISFIPLLIGLFAIPEVLKACTGRLPKQQQTAITISGSGDNDRATWADYKHSFKAILRGSFIGVIFGAIPGVGPAPAAFMAYNEARRMSPNRLNFGKGELEGVAAPEASNSACGGACLIPMLSLGVPGDVVTAVMLGAFMIHNLTPGPLLFQDNIVIIYALYFGLMISSVFLYITGVACVRSFAKISKVPKSILYPSILLICCYGAFSINNSMFDVLVMAILGVVGYGLSLLRFPEAPMLVAFVLAPLFENNLRRSLLISHGSPKIFFSSAVCWVFFFLTVLSIAYTVYAMLRDRRAAQLAN